MKSAGATPRACRNLPAGELALMLPAGEMWSVVIESPKMPITRALWMSLIEPTCIVMPSKYGGFLM